MNLYIFNEHSRATLYGIGTYVNELLYSLSDSGINVNLITLNAEVDEFTITKNKNITEWLIPSEQHSYHNEDERQELYSTGVVRLMKLHIIDPYDMVVHINYIHNSSLIKNIRNYFTCRIVTVVHYMSWCFDFTGNYTQLQAILSKPETECTETEIRIRESLNKEQESLLAADAVVCLTNHTKNILQNTYKIPANKMVTVYNGLRDIASEHISSEERLSLKRKLFFDDEKLILFVGRINNGKGIDELIQAFREILKQKPDTRLIIAGDGQFENYMQSAEDIWAKITFTGRLSKDKLHNLYCIADLGVTPSFFETFGYVAVEMMMHRLPLAATATSGLNEIIDDGITGLKVEINEFVDKIEISVKDLENKILQLLNNPDKAKTMGAKGREKYLSKFESNIMKENMINVYQNKPALKFK